MFIPNDHPFPDGKTRMLHSHLTSEECEIIAHGHTGGCPQAEIARELGRHRLRLQRGPRHRQLHCLQRTSCYDRSHRKRCRREDWWPKTVWPEKHWCCTDTGSKSPSNRWAHDYEPYSRGAGYQLSCPLHRSPKQQSVFIYQYGDSSPLSLVTPKGYLSGKHYSSKFPYRSGASRPHQCPGPGMADIGVSVAGTFVPPVPPCALWL